MSSRWKKVKKSARKGVSLSKKLTLRGMLAGLGVLLAFPAEDALLGPIGVITAPFTLTFGIGLMGSALFLPDKAIERLFLKVTGVSDVLEGGSPSRHHRGRLEDDEGSGRSTYALGPARRTGKAAIATTTLLLGVAGLVGLFFLIKRAKRAPGHADLLIQQQRAA